MVQLGCVHYYEQGGCGNPNKESGTGSGDQRLEKTRFHCIGLFDHLFRRGPRDPVLFRHRFGDLAFQLTTSEKTRDRDNSAHFPEAWTESRQSWNP